MSSLRAHHATEPTTTPVRSACSQLTVIGARGSTEPQRGSGLLQPVGNAIAERFHGQATYVELEYPATIDRFDPPADIDLGESPSIGVANLVVLLNDAAMRSSDSCFVLLGYSQGAQVVGDALISPDVRVCGQEAGKISQEASDRILAIMLFGDPRFTRGEPFNTGSFDPEKQGLYPRPAGALRRYADRVQNYCARNDVTCQGRGGNLQGHVAYFTNSMPGEAVTFAAERISCAAG